jgi:hypothetical protein
MMGARAILRKLGLQNKKDQSSSKFFKGTLVHMLRKQNDCPVCLFCEEELKKFYWWYFYDYYGEPPWVIRVLKSNGFCSKHAWGIVEMKKGNQMSFVYRYLVRDLLSKLEKMSSRIYKESRGNIKPNDICPICEQISSISTLWTNQLVEHLKDLEIKELYFGSSGLCMKHFDQAFFFAAPNVCLILIEKQSMELNKLNRGLEELSSTLAGQAYKSEEVKGWIKALRLFAGREL